MSTAQTCVSVSSRRFRDPHASAQTDLLVCLLSSEWQGLRVPGAAELGAAAGAGGDGEIMQRSQRGQQDTGEESCRSSECSNISTELICFCFLSDLFVQYIH